MDSSNFSSSGNNTSNNNSNNNNNTQNNSTPNNNNTNDPRLASFLSLMRQDQGQHQGQQGMSNMFGNQGRFQQQQPQPQQQQQRPMGMGLNMGGMMGGANQGNQNTVNSGNPGAPNNMMNMPQMMYGGQAIGMNQQGSTGPQTQQPMQGGSMGGMQASDGRNKGRKFTPEEIKVVQNLIECCLRLYMSQNEAITALHIQRNIEPGFIGLVWQKLEEQNPEFFQAYNIRLRIKEQISAFNFLVSQQANLMQKAGAYVQPKTQSTSSASPMTSSTPSSFQSGNQRQPASQTDSQGHQPSQQFYGSNNNTTMNPMNRGSPAGQMMHSYRQLNPQQQPQMNRTPTPQGQQQQTNYSPSQVSQSPSPNVELARQQQQHRQQQQQQQQAYRGQLNNNGGRSTPNAMGQQQQQRGAGRSETPQNTSANNEKTANPNTDNNNNNNTSNNTGNSGNTSNNNNSNDVGPMDALFNTDDALLSDSLLDNGDPELNLLDYEFEPDFFQN